MKPRILITTGSGHRTEGLRRADAVGGVNYAEAVLQTGGLPFFLPNLEPALAAAYLDNADGVLFSGGPDVDPVHFGQVPHPDLGLIDEPRDLFELALYRLAKQRGLPVLGICRGVQLINVAEGGTLHQHLGVLAGIQQHSQHDKTGTLFHEVKLESGSLLAKAFNAEAVRTDSYHHQAVDLVGRNLRACGWTADGTIEALEGTGASFVLGVQWHPEMSFARYPEQIAPFEVFMRAVTAQLEGTRSHIVSV